VAEEARPLFSSFAVSDSGGDDASIQKRGAGVSSKESMREKMKSVKQLMVDE